MWECLRRAFCQQLTKAEYRSALLLHQSGAEKSRAKLMQKVLTSIFGTCCLCLNAKLMFLCKLAMRVCVCMCACVCARVCGHTPLIFHTMWSSTWSGLSKLDLRGTHWEVFLTAWVIFSVFFPLSHTLRHTHTPRTLCLVWLFNNAGTKDRWGDISLSG